MTLVASTEIHITRLIALVTRLIALDQHVELRLELSELRRKRLGQLHELRLARYLARGLVRLAHGLARGFVRLARDLVLFELLGQLGHLSLERGLAHVEQLDMLGLVALVLLGKLFLDRLETLLVLVRDLGLDGHEPRIDHVNEQRTLLCKSCTLSRVLSTSIVTSVAVG